jgi:hypothetical protein
MTLHGRKNRKDVTGRNWWQLFMVDPLLIESTIWANEKSLFQGWGLSKCVGDVCPIYE